MKTIVRSLVLASILGPVGFSQAQNLSLSYIVQILPGDNLIANQLNTGGNTLAELFPKVPDGTGFRKFNNTTKLYEVRTFDSGGWAPDGKLTLLPGEGGFLSNPTREPFVLSFKGDIRGGVLPLDLSPGTWCLSRPTLGPASYEDLVRKPPSPGTTLNRWEPFKQQFLTYTFASDQWSPSAPALNVGEAAFIEVPRVQAPPIVEIDEFPSSLAQFTLISPNGASETIVLAGPTVVEVTIGTKGEASDTDRDGLDQVPTRITNLELRGTSSQGLVVVRLRTDRISGGEIEETANTAKGILDVPPFAASGRAMSFFDVWVEIAIGQQVLVPPQPLHIESVITHKPPAPGEAYQGLLAQPVPLLDASGRNTGFQISREIHIPNPPREIDKFAATQAEITLQLPTGATEKVLLNGPTVIVVDVPPDGAAADTDSDGREQVSAEMISLNLKGNSSLGPVQVSLDLQQRSRGEIEETKNNTPGVLDVPPFTKTGTADSFFDVFFEIRVGDQRLHAARAARMQSVIQHKPPGPGDTYVNPFTEPIELLDANGNPTGIKLVREVHTPSPVEIDVFPASLAQITLALANGQTETVSLTGPTTVAVEIGSEGETTLTDAAGRDYVATTMTQLDLKGTSSVGPVHVGLDPSRASRGQIIEQANNTKGILDLPPFTATGQADSFFDVFFQIQVGEAVLHAAQAAHMQAVIRHKPPGPGDEYINPFTEPIELLDANGRATGIKLVREVHTPNPVEIEVDQFPNSTAVVDLMLPDGSSQTVTLSGPTTVHVLFEGGLGRARDDDADGLDDVATEMVQLDLKGTSPLGPVAMRLADPPLAVVKSPPA
jgi:hypothetical protein